MKPDLRVPCEALAEGELLLPEDTSRYVVKVHRLKEGDPLRLFDPLQGLEADAVVVSTRLPHVRVKIDRPPRSGKTFNFPVHLIQAVGKGDKPEQAVRDATALGAQSVRFVHTERGVAQSASDNKKERLLRVAAQVARQCGRADIPQILTPQPLAAVLAELPEGGLRLLCGWAPERMPLLSVATPERIASGAFVLIGPEGGLSDEEMNVARAVGFVVVDLGPYVLRTEVACAMVLGALRARSLSASK